MKLFLLTFICFACYQPSNGQTTSNTALARSTVGVAGASEKVNVGNTTYIIQQSIGQASITGTQENDGHIVRQGFIQPDAWDKIIDKNVPMSLEVVLYPNPFIHTISLAFSEKISSEIIVALFDLTGKKIFAKSFPANQQLDIDANSLRASNYILRVHANHKQFAHHIIKK